MTPTVFIDGEAGTTGLEIRQRLAGRRDLEVISIAPEHRKDLRARRERLNGAAEPGRNLVEIDVFDG